jgi:hypothetical protein
MLHNRNQNRVFEHIGMVACVKAVAITEHCAMVTRLLGFAKPPANWHRM